MEPAEHGLRYCRFCNTWKDPIHFGKNAKYADGLHVKCRVCDREYQKERKSQIEHKTWQPNPRTWSKATLEGPAKYSPKGRHKVARARERVGLPPLSLERAQAKKVPKPLPKITLPPEPPKPPRIPKAKPPLPKPEKPKRKPLKRRPISQSGKRVGSQWYTNKKPTATQIKDRERKANTLD